MQYGGRATRLRASESVWSIYIFAETKNRSALLGGLERREISHYV